MSRQLQDDVLELEMSCATAIDILNNLLTHEKLKGGLQQLEHTFELPIFFIESTLRPFELQASHKRIELIVMTSMTELDRALFSTRLIRVDEKKLAQVVRNFVSNAIKFTPDGGKVEIRAFAKHSLPSSSDGHIKELLRVEVIDSGNCVMLNKCSQIKVFS